MGIASLAGRAQPEPVSLETVFALTSPDKARRQTAIEAVEANWDASLTPMVLEILALINFEDALARDQVWRMLERATGKRLERDPYRWLEWLWEQDYRMHPDYPAFKRAFYAPIDDRFQQWFSAGMKLAIRLDEVLWGGVRVDGIPPLEHPDFIEAEAADYLDDDDVVFGVKVGDDARAYPKRILAWHELFNDTIGGVDVTCAYCTLCGAAIVYRQKIGDRHFSFGTSGFLYRSNKLMYDRQTHSLWSALGGMPVAGPLVGEGLVLEQLPIVTTTWGAWRRRHPDTKVLSLETGHDRDYGEGVAYRDYFATDRLMFPVSISDDRLRNKQEVVGVRLDGEVVAYSTRFLRRHRIHHDRLGSTAIVILTDDSGASRVYASGGLQFAEWRDDASVIDSTGTPWQVTEDGLQAESGQTLRRLPAHRAFWFGWYAQFPETRLVR